MVFRIAFDLGFKSGWKTGLAVGKLRVENEHLEKFLNEIDCEREARERKETADQ